MWQFAEKGSNINMLIKWKLYKLFEEMKISGQILLQMLIVTSSTQKYFRIL
jgi:hypothetical protein